MYHQGDSGDGGGPAEYRARDRGRGRARASSSPPRAHLIPTRAVSRPAGRAVGPGTKGRAAAETLGSTASSPSVRDAPGGPKAPEKYRQISALHALCQRTESLTSRSPPPPRRHLRDRQIEVLRGDRGSPPEYRGRDRIRVTAASDRAQHPRHVQHPGQSQPNLQHHGQKPPLHCPLPELRGTAAGRPARPGPGSGRGGAVNHLETTPTNRPPVVHSWQQIYKSMMDMSSRLLVLQQLAESCGTSTVQQGVQQVWRLLLLCLLCRLCFRLGGVSTVKHAVSALTGAYALFLFFELHMLWVLSLSALCYVVLLLGQRSSSRGLFLSVVVLVYLLVGELHLIDMVTWHKIRGELLPVRWGFLWTVSHSSNVLHTKAVEQDVASVKI
ncbi:Protein-serine O-palmitoleoyltransferase porcupine [Liparis tanakae]|uniref:Protein-serine O-palmitoleoyltransferase porcupine n=1 Tax=Liparis tanakae TaxID=230148 RepID=A0A4Z2G1M3_9TELE|nr:Protein-serine O-palmitoleoyltransferase porcupine [Liparis tanakae]